MQQATALYNYKAQYYDELSIKENDLLEVINSDYDKSEEDFILVQFQGRPQEQGLVPRNFIKIQPPAPPVNKAAKPLRMSMVSTSSSDLTANDKSPGSERRFGERPPPIAEKSNANARKSLWVPAIKIDRVVNEGEPVAVPDPAVLEGGPPVTKKPSITKPKPNMPQMEPEPLYTPRKGDFDQNKKRATTFNLGQNNQPPLVAAKVANTKSMYIPSDFMVAPPPADNAIANNALLVPSKKMWFDRIADPKERQAFVATLSKEEKLFQHAAFEIYTTELDYVEDLKVMMEVLVKPALEQQLLTPKEVEAIFSNLETLIAVHEYFLGELERVMDTRTTRWPLIQNISEAFLVSAQYFPYYTEYCCNHGEGVKFFYVKMDDANFARFIKEAMTKKECKKLDVPSFLIKPVQRVCRYPLLIKELLKHCPENHPEYPGLKEVLTCMEAVAFEVNERMRDAANIDKLKEIASKIKSDTVEIIDKDRRFLMEGAVQSIENGKVAGERYLFLFNDKLLLTRHLRKNPSAQYKLLAELPLASLAVNDVPDPSSSFDDPSSATTTGPTMFDLIKLGKNIYTPNIAFRIDAGADTNRWLNEFDKLRVKRNQQLEAALQSMSEKEEMLAPLLEAAGSVSFEDPLERYRRNQEENLRKEREAHEEARRQAEETKRLIEEAAIRRMEEAQRQMDKAKKQAEKERLKSQQQQAAEDLPQSEELRKLKDEVETLRLFCSVLEQANLRLNAENEQLKQQLEEARTASSRRGGLGVPEIDEEQIRKQHRMAVRRSITSSTGPQPIASVPKRGYYHQDPTNNPDA